MTDAPPDVPAAPARHLPRPRLRRRSSTTFCGLGVTAVELMPVHHFASDRQLLGQGPRQLLGLQLDRILRPPRGLRQRGRSAGERVQVDGAHPPPRRHRSHPRRRLQPHRRGQPARAHALAAGHRQLGLLPPHRPRTRATTSTTPAPATASIPCTRARWVWSRTAFGTG